MGWIEQYVTLLQQGKVATASLLKQQHLPQQIYKYVSLANLRKEKLECLANDQVWLASPALMNDPYDSSLHFQREAVAEELIRRIFESFSQSFGLDKEFSAAELNELMQTAGIQKHIEELLIKKYPRQEESIRQLTAALNAWEKERHISLIEDFSQQLKQSLKIACFSELHDSTLMWAHYADSHRGICVAYDFKTSPQAKKWITYLHPVHYTGAVFNATQPLVEESDAVALLAVLASLQKGTDWSYEREWRLLVPGGIIKEDQRFLVPSPAAIYLGVHASKTDKDEIGKIAGAKGIALFQMKKAIDANVIFSVSAKR